jgi:hypothetical protein
MYNLVFLSVLACGEKQARLAEAIDLIAPLGTPCALGMRQLDRRTTKFKQTIQFFELLK